jgi:hypothetical protein
MQRTRLLGSAVAAALCAGGGLARADDRSPRVSAVLEPSQEVPVVSSPAAKGRFSAEIDDSAQTIDYELSFSGLQAGVLMSHIHMAQPSVNGAIMVWLCGSTANPGPAGTQACPQEGTIRGTIRPDNIQTVTTQGIATGDFAELVAAIRNGLTYVNVHTTQSPGGEIRGQLRRGDGRR